MSFFKSVFLTSGLTMLSRVLAFFRDQVLAFYLGTSGIADAFFLAFRLPNILRSMFAEGAFQSAFVPILSRLGFSTNRGKEFINRILILLFLMTLGIVLVGEIFMPEVLRLLAPKFPNETFQIAVILARWMFPYIIIVSLVSFSVSILQVQKRFFLAGLSQVIFNAGFVALIPIFVNLTQNPALAGAFSVMTTGIIQVLFYLVFVKTHAKISKPIIRFPKTIRIFFQKFTPGIFGSSIYYINTLVSTAFATIFTGGLSILYYATRLFLLPVGVLGVAINSVLLPFLSESLTKNPKQAEGLFGKSILALLWLGLPISLGFFFRATPIISLLFEHGAFDAMATLKTSIMLQVFSLAIIPTMISGVLTTLFYAKGDTKTPASLSVWFFVIHVFSLIILTNFFGMFGLAGAVVISQWGRLLILSVVWIQKYKLFPQIRKISLLKIILLNLILGIGLYITKQNNLGSLRILADIAIAGISYFTFSFILGMFKFLKK
ncbi:MAG: murein biosynthesis integral membrane protein MurJ [Alphaproteobacteria bacterium]|nr:MAG: murein biosynthesis integral membrane protein MurJ [Rickettsiaceae bacterium 4572_127]